MVDFEPENPLDSKQERKHKTENAKGKGLIKTIRIIGKFVKGFFSEEDENHWRRDLDDW